MGSSEYVPWSRRPVAAHRFSIEVDVVCAADMGAESLVVALTQLATAGLHGMVASVRGVTLDGKRYDTAWSPDAQATDAIRELRPPPDPKVLRAIHELETIVAALRSSASDRGAQ